MMIIMTNDRDESKRDKLATLTITVTDDDIHGGNYDQIITGDNNSICNGSSSKGTLQCHHRAHCCFKYRSKAA